MSNTDTTHQVPLVFKVRIIELIETSRWDCVLCRNPLIFGTITLIYRLVIEVSDWQLHLFVMYDGSLLTVQHSLLFCMNHLNIDMMTCY